MFAFTKWFKKTNDDDYENALAAIALDIQKRQTRLSEIRLRERRATLLTTLYTLAAWVLYISMWYVGALPGRRYPSTGFSKALAGAPVVIGPIVILFIRRIVQIWYTTIGDAEEKTLKALLKQQREKVEEIKKKTNYYSTKNLIERYDDPSGSPLRQMSPSHLRTTAAPPGTPPPRQPLPPVGSPPGPVGNSQLPQPGVVVPLPLAPPRKQWYDRLLDALVGEVEHETTAPQLSRYALICEKCFSHNGLVKESMWEDAQYTCPKCGHFNASVRSKTHRTQPTSPSPPLTRITPPPETTAVVASEPAMDVDTSVL